MLRAARANNTVAQDSHLDHADERLAEAREELDEAIVATTSPVGWRERLSRLPWKRIGLTTLALFVVTLVVITAFELVTGQGSLRSLAGPTPATPRSGTSVGATPGTGPPERSRRPADWIHRPKSEDVEPSNKPTQSTGPSETQEPSPADSTAPPESPTPTPAETTAP